MPAECVLALDNVSLARPALCTEKVTTLGPEAMDAVCRVLRVATAC